MASLDLRAFAIASCMLLGACGDDPSGRYDDDPIDDTTEVGTFSGLFDDVAVGFNYPYDIGLVPTAVRGDVLTSGDILVANYGTSEVLLARDPSGGGTGTAAEPFYDGGDDGLRGAMAVSVAPDGTVWAAFERGGDGDSGGIAVLSPDGDLLNLIDASVASGAFSSPSGICYGEDLAPGGGVLFFMINKGDGSAWRIDAANMAGDDVVMARVGSGLATGTLGNPGTTPDGVKNKKDLPEGGARGCAYLRGRLYVADAQNSRIVRFDEADVGEDMSGVALEDTPSDLVTYPTDVTINNEETLIVISFDNAHAFVALETPTGAFYDNGLHDLNVNSGNYGTQVADGTIWFTRANNENGALRAITQDQDTPPTTDGEFPPQ